MRTPEKKRRSRKFARAISLFLLPIFVAFSTAAIYTLYGTWRTSQTMTELKEIKDEAPTEEWNPELLKINEDYVGWLSVYGTGVDGPVVQGEDNDEYLRRDFYGNYFAAGTFFMDERVDCMEENGNRIIYGHMMNDETMFGSLKHYLDIDFFKENNIVRWEDRFGEHFYKLFAALLVSGSTTNTNYLDIQQWAHHLNEEETKEMLTILEERSYIYQPDNFRGEGQYIFLVTCEYSQYEGKLILVGKEI